MHSRDRPVTRLLLAHQTAEPDALVETLAAAVVGVGGRDVALYLIDYAHVVLTSTIAVLGPGGEPDLASLDGSMAGRAFTSSTVVAAEHDDGWHVWVPVSEQSNRLGVLAMTLPRWDDQIEFLLTELGWRPPRCCWPAPSTPICRICCVAAGTWTWQPRCSGRCYRRCLSLPRG